MSVRASAGTPARKSIRGNVNGASASVNTQFIRSSAAWLAATVDMNAMDASNHGVTA